MMLTSHSMLDSTEWELFIIGGSYSTKITTFLQIHKCRVNEVIQLVVTWHMLKSNIDIDEYLPFAINNVNIIILERSCLRRARKPSLHIMVIFCQSHAGSSLCQTEYFGDDLAQKPNNSHDYDWGNVIKFQTLYHWLGGKQQQISHEINNNKLYLLSLIEYQCLSKKGFGGFVVSKHTNAFLATIRCCVSARMSVL